MKLGIMQPYFLPYLGYLCLLKKVDRFVLFDTPQFIRHGWIERNRIVNQQRQPIYIKVPLHRHSRSTPIKDVVINDETDWRGKILAQLGVYRKIAPYYWEVFKLLKEALDYDTASIVKLDDHLLSAVCGYLGIPYRGAVFSEMGIDVADRVQAPDEWALHISLHLGATAYYNPIGGLSFFERDKYARAGLELKFVKMKDITYSQNTDTFVPDLSVVDAMMFNPPERIRDLLDECELV